MTAQHYCNEHRSKFYMNEKTAANGELKVWYSHKKADGTGFCVEKQDNVVPTQLRLPETVNPAHQTIFSCNAMNNAVSLAANGKIELNQIGDFYKRLLSELSSTY